MMDEAVNSIRKALEIDPEKADAHYYLGVISASGNKYNEAIEAFKKVIAVDSNYADAHFDLGTIYHKQELFKEAIEEYDIVIQIDRGYADAYYNKSAALEKLGDAPAAHDEFEKYRMIRKTAGGSPSLLEFDAKLTGAAEKDDAFQKHKIAAEAMEEAKAFEQKEKAAGAHN
jgi:tetratricopeptide (TPR) repeat protein